MVAANDIRRYISHIRDTDNNHSSTNGKSRHPLIIHSGGQSSKGSSNTFVGAPERRWAYSHTERQRNYRNALRLARASRRSSTPAPTLPLVSPPASRQGDADPLHSGPEDELEKLFEGCNWSSSGESSDELSSQSSAEIEHHHHHHHHHQMVQEPAPLQSPTSPKIAFQALQVLPQHHFPTGFQSQNEKPPEQGSNNQHLGDPAHFVSHIDWEKYWASHPIDAEDLWNMDLDEGLEAYEHHGLTPSSEKVVASNQDEGAGGRRRSSGILDTEMEEEPECCPWPGCDWNEPTRLNTHIRRSHLKGLHCPVNGCTARFGEQWQIRNHIKSVHAGVLETLPGKPQLESEVNFIQERLFSGRNKYSHPTKIAICAAQSPAELESIPGLRSRVRIARNAWESLLKQNPSPPKSAAQGPVRPPSKAPAETPTTTTTTTTKKADDFGDSALEAFRLMDLSESDAHSASIFASVLKRGFVDHRGTVERERALHTFQLALDYTSTSINPSWIHRAPSVTTLENTLRDIKAIPSPNVAQLNTSQSSTLPLNTTGFLSNSSNSNQKISFPPNTSTAPTAAITITTSEPPPPAMQQVFDTAMPGMAVNYNAGFTVDMSAGKPQEKFENAGSLDHERLISETPLWYQ